MKKELKSFAKINLGLEITGKRPDGFHNLKTIFQTVDVFDIITIKENRTGSINLSGDEESVEWNESNTIIKAFDAIYKNYNVNKGFDVFVEKRIPTGSGLGGGSSNAAVILLFLYEYFKLNLTLEDLIDIGAKIGADVPFFLLGGTVLARGIGEKMTPLEDGEEKHVHIVVPDVKVSTRLIFSRFNLTSEPIKSKIDTFVKSQDYKILENNLEKVTFELFPEVGVVKEKMRALDYDLVLMSGSGSAVYGMARAQEWPGLKNRFPGANINVFATRTIGRQNYFDRIGAWPSGKAPVFGAGIRRFESSRPRNP